VAVGIVETCGETNQNPAASGSGAAVGTVQTCGETNRDPAASGSGAAVGTVQTCRLSINALTGQRIVISTSEPPDTPPHRSASG
jgi:hypothetical protein